MGPAIKMTNLSKAKRNAIQNNPEYKNLINAVIRRVGLENVENITNYGISGDYGGFIYYVDTVAFWRKYRKDITDHMKNFADELGESMGGFLSSFNCFKGYEEDELLEAFYGPYNDEFMTIYNGFAWYAAEEVCRMIERELEEL